LASYWYGWDSPGYHTSSSNSIIINKWSHVAVSWEQDSGVQFYINGEVDRFIVNDGIGESTNWVRIGQENSGRRYNGLIDDVRIYETALTSVQVEALYYAGLDNLYNKGLIDKKEYQEKMLASIK
jgi:hypothetical protein